MEGEFFAVFNGKFCDEGVNLALGRGERVWMGRGREERRGEKEWGADASQSAFIADPSTRRHLIPPTQTNVDFRAACFCHKRVVDIGFVCSICLSSEYSLDSSSSASAATEEDFNLCLRGGAGDASLGDESEGGTGGSLPPWDPKVITKEDRANWEKMNRIAWYLDTIKDYEKWHARTKLTPMQILFQKMALGGRECEHRPHTRSKITKASPQDWS